MIKIYVLREKESERVVLCLHKLYINEYFRQPLQLNYKFF